MDPSIQKFGKLTWNSVVHLRRTKYRLLEIEFNTQEFVGASTAGTQHSHWPRRLKSPAGGGEEPRRVAGLKATGATQANKTNFLLQEAQAGRPSRQELSRCADVLGVACDLELGGPYYERGVLENPRAWMDGLGGREAGGRGGG